jgi:hypothetical protein
MSAITAPHQSSIPSKPLAQLSRQGIMEAGEGGRMTNADHRRKQKIRRVAVISITAVIVGAFMVGGTVLYGGGIPVSTNPDEGTGSGGDIVILITAIAGLISAAGGLCGGIAALIMARHTVRQPQQPATPPPAPVD